jgi:hypothetical protein
MTEPMGPCRCTAGRIKLTPEMACPNEVTTHPMLCDTCWRQECNTVIKYPDGPWVHARLSLGFQSHQITVDTTIAIGLGDAQWEET